MLQGYGKKQLVVSSCNLPVFLRCQNNVEIFVGFLHPVLLSCEFLEVMIISLQFMKFLPVRFFACQIRFV